MGYFYLFQQTDPFGRYNQFLLTGITDTQVNTILSIMIGKVLVFKGQIDETTPLEDKPDKLNTQVFSCGRNLLGGRYERDSFTLKDMKNDKTLVDVRAVKESLDCHKDIDEPAEYVNLVDDKRNKK